jgi:hypothetical protein
MNVATQKEASFMSFNRNIPGWERTVRAALGIGLLAVVWIVPLTGLVSWIVGLSGGAMIASAMMGFCPACAVAGRRLPGSP